MNVAWVVLGILGGMSQPGAGQRRIPELDILTDPHSPLQLDQEEQTETPLAWPGCPNSASTAPAWLPGFEITIAGLAGGSHPPKTNTRRKRTTQEVHAYNSM